MRTWETAAALVKNTDEIIEQEVKEAVAYLKPPPIDETMPETESESSSDDK